MIDVVSEYQRGWDDALELADRLCRFIGLFWSLKLLAEPSRALAKEAAVSRGWRVCAVSKSNKGHLWNTNTTALGLYRQPALWDAVSREACQHHAKRT